ncbi:MAG: winged helix-turn-helix transcriptional regulator [Neisseriaceae bacterium]|nr:winged helix-turn-helix transcriptional regulator [Neisseriaceae bacterium]
MIEHNNLTEVGNDLIIEIFQLKTLLLDQGDALVAPIGLTSARWQVLGAISRSTTRMTVPMIAEAMGLSRQGVQKQVNQMLAEGVCQHLDNPLHARSDFIVLTDKGRASFAQAMSLSNIWVQSLTQGQSREEMMGALSVLKALHQRLVTSPVQGA